MRAAFALATTMAIAALGCGPSDDEFLDCQGKCDSIGPLSVSTTWAPVGGFVRAVVNDGGDLEVEPTDGVSVDRRSDDRFIVQFDQPGFFALKTGAVELRVRVSDDGPVLALEGAGTFVELGDRTSVAIAGSMTDPLGTPLDATINGGAVALDGSGQFRGLSADAAFGVNFVQLEAIDLAGNRFRHVASFVAAPTFSLGEKSAVVGLGTDALSTIATELSDELPTLLDLPVPSEPVFSSVGQDVMLERFVFPGQGNNPGSIRMQLESRDGRLVVSAFFDGESRVEGVIDGIVSSSGFVARMQDLRVSAELTFSSGPGGVVATTSAATVSTTDSSVEVVSLVPDFIFEWLAGDLDDHVADVIKSDFGPWLTDVFSSAEGDFDLPAPGPDLPMDYRLGAIEPGADGLEVRVFGAIDRGVAARRGPGAPTNRPQTLAAPAGTDLGVVLEYDLINQYLYRLWERERFAWDWNETDLADAIAKVPALERLDPILEITAVAALPPVATRGERGSELSLGELHVEVLVQTTLFQATVRGSIGVRADVEFPVENGQLVPVATLGEVHANVEQRAFDGLDVEAVEALLVELAPEAFSRITADLKALPIPTFDLSALALEGHRLGLADGASGTTAAGISIVGQIEIVD